MTQSTDAARRAQLTAEHQHLMTQLAHIGRAPADVVSGRPADPEGGDLSFDEGFADTGQVTAERGEVDALATSLLEGLHDIDDALAKFDAGTYGTCESCGTQISEGRLEAVPSARFCIACASARR